MKMNDPYRVTSDSNRMLGLERIVLQEPRRQQKLMVPTGPFRIHFTTTGDRPAKIHPVYLLPIVDLVVTMTG